MSIQTVYDRRATLHEEQKGLFAAINARDGIPTPEELEKRDKMFRDFDALTDQIRADEKMRLQETELAKRSDEHAERNQAPDGSNQSNSVRGSQEFRDAFRDSIVAGGFTPEFRAMQADLETVGGYTVLSEQLNSGIIQAIDNLLPIKSLCTTIRLPYAQTLSGLKWATDVAAPTRGGEINTATEETSARFGKVTLTPHKENKYLKISKDLLRKSSMNLEQFIIDRLAYQFANEWEGQILTGGGGSDCLGLLTASDSGIPTGRDYSTDMATDNVSAKGLIGVKMNLKSQYRNRPSTRWIFSRGGVRRILQLQTGDAQFIWQPGLQVGQPDRLLGIPVIESELCSDTWTTGLYVGLLGDLSQYWVAEVENLDVFVGQELYALTFQAFILVSQELDGMPISPSGEAFSRVTLG